MHVTQLRPLMPRDLDDEALELSLLTCPMCGLR